MSIKSLPLLHVVEPVPARESALAALHLMLDLAINHLPVVDETGGYLGLLSLHDLLREILPAGIRLDHGQSAVNFLGDASGLLSKHLDQLATRTAGEAADTEVLPLAEDCPLAEAARRLAEAHIPLPVVDAAGRVAGVLSVRLLFSHLIAHGGRNDAR